MSKRWLYSHRPENALRKFTTFLASGDFHFVETSVWPNMLITPKSGRDRVLEDS